MRYVRNIRVLILCIFILIFNLDVYGADSISNLFRSAAESVSNAAGQSADAGNLTESFDINSGFYNEKLGEGLEFLSSIPNGAVVNDAVYFDIPLGLMNAELEYEGSDIDFNNKTLIYNKGYYILRLTAPTSSDEDLVGVFTFRIGDPPQNRVKSAAYKYPVVSCNAAISDFDDGMYRYMLPSYKAFLTNVPGYGESVENARFVIPRNLGYSLTRNGQKLSLVNNQVYSTPGTYYLKVYGSGYATGNGYETYYETVLNFSIASEDSGDGSSSSSGSSGSGSSIGSSLSSAAGSIGSAASSIGSAASSVSSAARSTGSSISSGANSISSSLSSLSSRFGSSNTDTDLINDYLSETFFESANLYSETFSSGDAFYTNTPNDGIVGGNVYIDIPHNMTVTMTKDGLPVAFTNKTYINEKGSYSLLVTNTDGEDVNTARYTFRIQEGVDRSPSASGAFSINTQDEQQSTDAPNDELDSSYLPQVDASDINMDTSVKYENKNTYDPVMGMYSFKAGETTFYSSVPDGMISNYNVKLDVPSYAELELKKDGEDIPLPSENGGEIEDDGHYELTVTDESGEKTTISFDIVYYSTNAFDKFIAPEGYYIIASNYEDYYGTYTDIQDDKERQEYNDGYELIMSQQETPSNVYEMPLDGEYDFILQSQEGMPVISTTFILDRIAPVVEFEGLDKKLKTKNESVVVYCYDPEATLVLMDESGSTTKIELEGNTGTINGNGQYSLLAGDMAGNMNEYKISLGKGGSVKGGIFRSLLFFILPGVLVLVGILLFKLGVLSVLTAKARNKFGSKKGKKPHRSQSHREAAATDDGAGSGDDWESGSDDGWENNSDDGWENNSDDGWESSSDDDWEETSNVDWGTSDDDDWENS